MTPTLLTIKEAAQVLRISEATLRSLVTRKQIRHERIGLGRGKIMIPEDAIEEYRRSRTVEANGGGCLDSKPAPKKEARPAFKHIRVP
jgi:excisionase family DNA binding protein